MRTLVLDNGSFEIKVGWADSAHCLHVTNAMMRSRDRRTWLGNAVSLCKDLTGLQFRRPIDRGQLFSWELEKAIWDWVWDSKEIVASPDEFKESILLLTESPGSLPSSSANTDQIVFEEYEFARYRRSLAQSLAANSSETSSEARLVVDLGFHATHVVPIVGKLSAINSGVRRLDVGGKILTNYLKELISYRYYNMMEESAILNRIKERACFMSTNYLEDLETWHQCHTRNKASPFAVGYALPSTHEDPYGHLMPVLSEAVSAQKKGDKQVLILDNERFSIPEALYDPAGHLGLEQSPLPETVASSIFCCPSEYQPILWSNIVLCGGTANLPNTEKRLFEELRKLAPSNVPVTLHKSIGGRNEEAAWQGGVNLASDASAKELSISREEYLEEGSSHVFKRFSNGSNWRP